jgi:hypothetical protein
MIRTSGIANRATLAVSLLLLLSCAPFARAQAPNVEKVFSGWVGTYPVRMTLRRGAGGRLNGSYSYEGRAGSLALKGAVGADGAFTLEEFDGAKQTGAFKGTWREKEYEPEARLEGEWTKPGGGGTQSFTLEEELVAGSRVTTKHIKEQNKARGYEVDASYPQVQGADKFNLLVEQMVTKLVADFKRNRGDKPPAGAPANALGVGYSMRLATDDIQSAVFTVSDLEYGMAHASYEFRVVNYDAKAGRQLALADLFRPGSNYLQKISAGAVARLRMINQEYGEEQPTFLGDPEYVENASAKAKNYRNWTLTTRGLVVTFEPYQVGSFAAGSPSVLIPYSELKDVLKPGGPLAPLSK